jgi:dGTPase
LVEAVSLAHDLGHPPFGHTGEDALDAEMQAYGGFDHNAQALRIVTALEQHYAQFDGLNLTWECLEGIAKHNGPVALPHPPALLEYNLQHDLELHSYASAEAQVAALADDVAYNNHDLHDGLRAGVFTDAQAEQLPIVGPAYAQVDRLYSGLDAHRRRHEALRRVFGVMVEDVMRTSAALLAQSGATTAQDIRNLDYPVVQFSPELWSDLKVIRDFLFQNMYRATRVVVQREHAAQVVRDLFETFMTTPGEMPAEWEAQLSDFSDTQARARLVADYIAGMTDRFAQQEHDRLFGAR